MISCCVNPACRTNFKLFNSGHVYAHERPLADTEFYWICSPCAARFEPYLDAHGQVSVRPRPDAGGSQPPHPDGGLRVVSRPEPRIPWRRAIPAGEAEPSAGFGLELPPSYEAA